MCTILYYTHVIHLERVQTPYVKAELLEHASSSASSLFTVVEVLCNVIVHLLYNVLAVGVAWPEAWYRSVSWLHFLWPAAWMPGYVRLIYKSKFEED